MDISEIWNHLGYLAPPIVALILFVLSRRIPHKWVRIPARVGSIMLFLIAGFVLFIDGCELITATARRPGIISPDGKHVALTYWVLVGAVGFDHVHISVRSRYNPAATEVFTGLANNTPNDPEVRWLDDHRLLISYW